MDGNCIESSRHLEKDISPENPNARNAGKRQRLSLKKWKRNSTANESEQNVQNAGHRIEKIQQASLANAQSGEKETTKLDNNLNRILCPVSTLNNLGNTCYINSILYALRYMNEFQKSLHHLSCRIQELASNAICNYHLDLQDKVILDLHELFRGMRSLELEENGKGQRSTTHLCKPLNPTRLMESLRKANDVYEGNRQHDAHEFLGFLLTCLEKTFQTHEHWLTQLQSRTVTRRNKKALTVVQNNVQVTCPIATFEGTSLLKTLCLECETYSEMEDKFRDVAIPCLSHLEIAENENDMDGFIRALQMKERLRDEEKFWCNVCYHHNEAFRTGQFVRLPPILIIQLKPALMSTAIIAGNVSFPSEPKEPIALPHLLPCLLDSCTKPCLHVDHQFQLSAIICHIGSSLSSGHYTVYLNGSSVSSETASVSSDSDEVAAPQQQQLQQRRQEVTVLPRASRYNTRKTASSDGDTKENPPPQQPQLPNVSHGDCCRPGDLLSPNRWLHFDDETLSGVQNLPKFHCENSTETPYLLFYQRLAEMNPNS